MADLQQLIKNIEQWAEDRNLIEGSTPQKQILKLIEEYGELTSGVIKNNAEKIKDSIGDCLVVLSVLNSQFKKRGEVFKFDKYLTEILSLELDSNHGLNKEEVIIDGLSALHSIAKDDFLFDFILVLRFIAYETSLRLEECMQATWDEIKDRKGRMIDGVFVKEDDLVEVCDYFEIDLTDCVKAAWDKIKDRKGRMIDGVFVKEGDL